MNLLPIIYSSLLIFCTLAVIIIFSSFILYKIKGTKVSNSIEEIPFVLRKPVTLATANSNIVYRKASVLNSPKNSIAKKPYSNRANKPSTEAQLNNKIIKAAYEHFTHHKERRYQILATSSRQQQGGGGYVGNNYQQNIYSPHYFYEDFNDSKYSVGNSSNF